MIASPMYTDLADWASGVSGRPLPKGITTILKPTPTSLHAIYRHPGAWRAAAAVRWAFAAESFEAGDMVAATLHEGIAAFYGAVAAALFVSQDGRLSDAESTLPIEISPSRGTRGYTSGEMLVSLQAGKLRDERCHALAKEDTGARLLFWTLIGILALVTTAIISLLGWVASTGLGRAAFAGYIPRSMVFWLLWILLLFQGLRESGIPLVRGKNILSWMELAVIFILIWLTTPWG
jgi:hypothetical protein